MSVEAHIESLQSKHASLETALAEEIARPNPDFYMVKDIKKQKLIIKEEIFRLSHQMEIKHKNAS